MTLVSYAGLTVQKSTFTPTLIGSSTAGVQTYTTQSGIITKIGPLIAIELDVAISAKDAGIAGNVRVGGIPFTGALAAGAVPISEWTGFTLTASYTHLSLQQRAVANTLALIQNGSAQPGAFIAVTAMAATSQIRASGIFTV